jgi:transmembrane protein TMEM220
VSGFSRTLTVRFLDLTMALLFAFAAALQFNDPDPVQWIAIYSAACALSLVACARRRVPPAAAILVFVIAIVWAALIAFGGPAASEYGHMFDAWEMKSPSVEEAREASGLLIVAAWMAVLFIRARRASGMGSDPITFLHI